MLKVEGKDIVYGFRKKDRIAISEIPYLAITGCIDMLGRSMALDKQRRFKPMMTFLKKLEWKGNYGLNGCFEFCDRNEVLFQEEYDETFFREILSKGFQGEIHVLDSIYQHHQEEWSKLARKYILDMERVKLHPIDMEDLRVYYFKWQIKKLNIYPDE